MQEFESTELVTISLDNLEHVSGGGLLKLGQKAYQWWTKTGRKIPSPKAIFDEGVHVVTQLGKMGGIGGAGAYAGKKVYDWWTGGGGGDHPQPPAQPQE